MSITKFPAGTKVKIISTSCSHKPARKCIGEIGIINKDLYPGSLSNYVHFLGPNSCNGKFCSGLNDKDIVVYSNKELL
jgi:hypothetical protein